MALELEPPESAGAWDGSWPQSLEEFEALVGAYLDRLVAYAFRRLGSIEDAEDAVQEVFVRAYAQWSNHKTISRTGPYLYRMAANVCTDFLRKRRGIAMPLDDIEAEQIPSDTKSPSELAAAVEELHRAEALLERLPRAQAEAIRLRLFDELRLNEIADVLGCSINTVSSRLRYGFRKLRKIVSRKRGTGS